MPERLPPLSGSSWLMTNYFLNLLRPNTAKPTKPEPSSTSVTGSGTVEGPVSEGIVASGVDLKLYGATGLASSPGQPTIPKNIITTHKNTKYPLILFSFYYMFIYKNGFRF